MHSEMLMGNDNGNDNEAMNAVAGISKRQKPRGAARGAVFYPIGRRPGESPTLSDCGLLPR